MQWFFFCHFFALFSYGIKENENLSRISGCQTLEDSKSEELERF